MKAIKIVNSFRQIDTIDAQKILLDYAKKYNNIPLYN